MCQHCRHSGSWDILERFFDKKAPKKTQELKLLKQTLPFENDFTDKWDKICKSCRKVSDLSGDEFQSLIKKFELPVSK